MVVDERIERKCYSWTECGGHVGIASQTQAVTEAKESTTTFFAGESKSNEV